jgi:hypothetical protein
MNFTIKTLTQNEVREAAKLHKITYEKDHFTSRFTIGMLSDYYLCIAQINSYSFVAVDENNKVVGVALAGQNTRQSIKQYIKKYWYMLIAVLVMNPSFILQKILHFKTIFFAPKNKFTSKAKVRYLNLLVSPELHGKGVAQLLTAAIENSLRKDGITMYGHSVKKNNIKTIKFHLKNGCEIEHEDENVVYFTKKL